MSRIHVFSIIFVLVIFSNRIYSQTKNNQMEQNRIQAILTLDMENLPANFQEIIKHEQEVVAKWKEEGILESLFLRQGRNGAVLIFKGVDEEKVKKLMMTLPLYPLRKSVEYFGLIKQF